MIVKQRENRSQMEIFSIEGFVPEEHLLRNTYSSSCDIPNRYIPAGSVRAAADHGRALHKSGRQTAKIMRGLRAFAELSGQFIQFSPCYQGLRGAANQCEAILAPDNILIIRRVDQLAGIKQALQPAVPLGEY